MSETNLGPEKRTDVAFRRLVEEMTPAEMRYALKTDYMTGLGNRRAYTDSAKKAFQVCLDIDDLKWINDNLGHDAGDAVIKLIGRAFNKHPDVYHISGDEFVVQADSEAEAQKIISNAYQYLEKNRMLFETCDDLFELQAQFSYGMGESYQEADQNLNKDKEERRKAGLQSARGERPAKVTQCEDQYEYVCLQSRYALKEQNRVRQEVRRYMKRRKKLVANYENLSFFKKCFKKIDQQTLNIYDRKIENGKNRLRILKYKIQDLERQKAKLESLRDYERGGKIVPLDRMVRTG